MCHDTYSAHQGVEHDDMNVLCIGARILGPALASEVVAAFVAARFVTTEERYARRLRMVAEIERERR
jgi:ribose 5-phosphate isomerase B